MRLRPGTLLASLVVTAVTLASCHVPARLGVSTTVMRVSGTCDTSAVVEVGAALPLTGADAAVGRAELTGLRLAINQVNDAGGVLSSHRCLELLYKDDESSPAVDNQALLDLVNEERVSLVVGPFLALAEPSDRDHLGTLGVTAATFSSDEVAFTPHGYPNTYPVGSSTTVLARAMAATAKRRHWHRVAVLSTGSLASSEGARAFTAAARRSGIVVMAAPRRVDSRATASAALAAVSTTHPQALIVFDDGSSLAPVLAARQARHSSLPVLASNVGNGPASPINAVDVVVPSALVVEGSPPTSLARFRRQVLRILHRSGLNGSLLPYAQAYDAVTMFAGAANGVNADDATSIRTYLENANYEGILGSYNYTSSAHTGLDGSQVDVAPLSSLSNGIFVQAKRLK